MRCFSIDLSGEFPAVSLLSYWLMLGLEEKYWVMQRGGMLVDPPFTCVPPIGVPTDEIVFVGTPLEGIEFANRLEIDGMSCSLWVVGVGDNTPPVSQAMFKNIKSVSALKETAHWLRRCGLSDVAELVMPKVIIPEVEDTGKEKLGGVEESEGTEEMRIVVTNEGRVKPPLPFKADVKHFHWATNGEVLLPTEVAAKAVNADVCLVGEFIMDDPIRAVFEAQGVPCVASRPREGQWGRLAEAARLRRAGILRPLSMDKQIAHEKSRNSDDIQDKFASLVTPRLGIVIPFGGLPVDGLAKTLKRLKRTVPEDVQIVVSYQEPAGWNQKGTYKALDELTQENNVTLVDSSEHYKRWNLSAARNYGATQLDLDITHVMFLDADIMVDRGFFDLLIGELSVCPLVPWVCNEDGTTRIASGLATYYRPLFERALGFDELFLGWGYEDLELLARCRCKGFPSLLIGSPAMTLLRHIDHEPRWEETQETRDESYKRYQAVCVY